MPKNDRRMSIERPSREQRRASIVLRNKKAEFYNRVKKLAHAPTEEQYLKDRHSIIIDVLEYLRKASDVFDTHCVEGESLSDETLDSLPVFWFKMHHWKAEDIRFFFDAIGRKRTNLEEEIASCYSGKKRRKGRKRRKMNKHIRRSSKIALQAHRQSIRSQRDKVTISPVLNTRGLDEESLGERLWDIFVKERGGIKECKDLNGPQWNIALNDSKIIADPDLSFELYICLLDTKEEVESLNDEEHMLKLYNKKSMQFTKEQNGKDKNIKSNTPMMATLGEDNVEENLEELTEHELNVRKVAEEKALRKRMKNTPLVTDHFKCMIIKLRELLNTKSGRFYRRSKAKELEPKIRNYIVYWKMFEALLMGEPFNIAEEYLADKLTEEELSSSKFILKQLSSRKGDWRHRLAILSYVEEHLDEEDKFQSLISDERFKSFIFGWTAQMLDDRSQLSSSAVQLFPSVLGTLITKKDSAHLFFEDNLLEHVFKGIFTVLRGRRAQELSKLAQDCAVRVMDIFGDLAEGGEDEGTHKPRSHSVHIRAMPQSSVPEYDSSANTTPIPSKPNSPHPITDDIKDEESSLQPLNESNNNNNKSNTPLKPGKIATPTSPPILGLKISTDSNSPIVRNKGMSRLRGRSLAKSPTIAKLAQRFEQFPDPNGKHTSTNGKSSRKSGKHSKRQSMSKIKRMKSTTPITHPRKEKRNSKRPKLVEKKTQVHKGVYMDLIEICVKHSTFSNEKHESVRASTMVLTAYLIYGIDNGLNEESTNNSSGSSDESKESKNEEESESKSNGKSTNGKNTSLPGVKTNKTPRRGFLMNIEQFLSKLKFLCNNGVNDRKEIVRTKCMKLIQKLEGTFGTQKLDLWFDNDVIYKYRKWSNRQKYANEKGKTKNGKGKGKNKSKGRENQRQKMARMRRQAMMKKKQEMMKQKQKEMQKNKTEE